MSCRRAGSSPPASARCRAPAAPTARRRESSPPRRSPKCLSKRPSHPPRLALQSDQRPQPADAAPDRIEKPAPKRGRHEQDQEGGQRRDTGLQQIPADDDDDRLMDDVKGRSEEHTYELQSLMRIS